MSNLINMSEAGFLALHSLALIVEAQPQRLNTKELAEKLQASPAHLAKVFQKLAKADLVKSVRGPAGGIELNKAPAEITFLEIFEVIEGKVNLGGCFLGKEKCPFEKCIFADKMSKLSAEIYQVYAQLKLSDFEDKLENIPSLPKA
ncbi:MAG: Rrf2 family transcriptional regulator [Candidatus Cloacimonadales bacterium]